MLNVINACNEDNPRQMKKIMILGAGIYQVPLIKKAKELGLFTIVASCKGNYPGFKYADKIYLIDIRDSNSILRVAKKERIDGICTTGSDVGVRSIGVVCDEMKLNGISRSTAELTSDKYEMKRVLQRHQIRTPEGYKVKTVEEAIEAYNKCKGLAVFKAVDNSGNRGVVEVKTKDNVRTAFNECYQYTKKEYIMVEEFLDGLELGAEAFVYKGRIVFILPHEKIVTRADSSIPVGQWVPCALDKEVFDDVLEQVAGSIRALKIDNSPVNVDIFIQSDKAFIVEVGSRAGGGACIQESVSLYYGWDQYSNILKVALSEEPDFNCKGITPNASQMIVSHKSGRIVSLNCYPLYQSNISCLHI